MRTKYHIEIIGQPLRRGARRPYRHNAPHDVGLMRTCGLGRLLEQIEG